MNNKILTIVACVLSIQYSSSIEYSEERYRFVDYNDMVDLVDKLEASPLYGSLLKIKDVFEEYPTIPKITCPNERASTRNCRSYLIEVANFDKGQAYVDKLPTVLIIAGFHGNEVTGTNSVYQFLTILNKYYYRNNDLYAMLQNVRLLLLPTANVNGFDNNIREETINGLTFDPNRDFPYDIIRKDHCFQTTTAMIIDTIFRENLIVGCLTFHGGVNSITYPWGNFAHEKQPKTGDDIAFHEVAQVLQEVSGENERLNIDKYKIGLLQDIVYDVHGGFEDWAYGASWDVNNVNNSCAVNVGFSSMVTRKSITYDDETNRAFVFLVEAGDDKKPKPHTLGNELALFDPDNKLAEWGHVTRNISLLMRFTEIVQPYLYIKDMQYSEILAIEIAIRGCVNLNSIDVSDFKATILNKKYNPNINEHTMVIALKNVNSYIPELKINYKCDESWKKPTENELPETHLVRMRTNPLHEARFSNYTLGTQANFQAKLLNIKTTVLEDRLIHMQPHDTFSLIYYDTYKAKLDDHFMLFTYNDGKLIVAHDADRKTYFEMVVYEYGTKGCCHENPNGKKPYLVLQSGKEVDISEQAFIELLGRNIEFKDIHTKVIRYSSFIELLNEDPYSTLLIPYNGLTCGTGDIDDYFYVTVKNFEDRQLRIEVMTGYQGTMKFKLEKFEDALFKDASFVSQEPHVSSHFSIIDVNSLNDLRVRGSPFALLDESDNILYECKLNMLNPYFSELDNLNFDVIRFNLEIQAKKPTQVVDRGLIIMLILMLFFVLAIIMYINKKNSEENSKVEVDREIDLQPTKDDGASMI